jgi:hypothetical protein
MMLFLAEEMSEHSIEFWWRSEYMIDSLIVEGGETNVIGHIVQGHEESFQREITSKSLSWPI